MARAKTSRRWRDPQSTTGPRTRTRGASPDRLRAAMTPCCGGTKMHCAIAPNLQRSTDFSPRALLRLQSSGCYHRPPFDRSAGGMVFFNYATMQMAAKIVYYGPGLCGKTTTLPHIHAKTSPQSRGEMVSLETETDRTRFFDLLPIDVGVIGGFKTRLQLYTIPGQVFYNTTRKLVLKGVDGLVFVADSQKAMLDANLESLKNLRDNLTELGVKIEDIPLVLQFNKRDLPNVEDVDLLREQ